MSYTSGRSNSKNSFTNPKYKGKGKSKKTNSKSNKKTKSTARKVFGKIGRVFLTIFLIAVITLTLVGGAGAIYVLNFVTPRTFDLTSANQDTTTIIYANDTKSGDPVEIARVNGEKNRIWVSIDDIPKNVQHAFVSTEDKRFYEHEGVDWKRTLGASFNIVFNYYGSRQGASTITQQLINNLSAAGKDSSNYGRKIQEIVDAVNMEKNGTSKDQILEAYLNTINLNEGCYGVETASENYFGKQAKDLNLVEAAALACMPKAPNTYDPRKNPEYNAKRRKTVLKNMLDQEYITKDEYDKAINTKLEIAPQKASSSRGWFEDMAINDVKTDLIKRYGWSSEYAMNAIYTKGYRIYTTMNPTIQKTMDTVYQDTKNNNYWNQYSGEVIPQSGMMIIDYTGQILGVAGGRGEKSGDFVLNRATSTTRSPGSSIKPLADYGPAIELDKINWGTPISKGQIVVDGNPWPKNDDNSAGSYTGSQPVVAGLAESRNTVAINIMNNFLTPEYSFNYLTEKLGFTTLVDRKTVGGKVMSDKTLSMGIGSLTNGVTVEEMCGAYQVFGNGGKYYTPHSYSKVTDAHGNSILENKVTPKQAFSEDTAFIMNKLLQSNCTRSGGTGQKAQISGVAVGGKTGTTNDHKDRWFCGITPDYVGCVWFGYDTPKEVPGYSTMTNPALKAWRAVVSQLPHKTKDYPTSDKVVQYKFDPSTGYIDENGSETGWFKKEGNLPKKPVEETPEESSSETSESTPSESSSEVSSSSSSPSSSSSSTSSSSEAKPESSSSSSKPSESSDGKTEPVNPNDTSHKKEKS